MIKEDGIKVVYWLGAGASYNALPIIGEMADAFRSQHIWVRKTAAKETSEPAMSSYFANVPEVAWNFYIGGYQPAQKWLKDRHGRTLTFDDIRHYQRMIVALNETAKVMEEVDGVGVV
jgi:hypothetical protein